MLRVEREGAVARFVIARHEARNALDEKTLRALGDAASSIGEDVRAVVLWGEGEAFCSGGDLSELRDRNTAADAEKLTDFGADVMAKIAAIPALTIAAIQGPAFGGGAELAVACDVRVVGPRARISFKQAVMGTTTSWGSTARLLRLVGHGGASLLLLTAMEVDADRALELGLAEVKADDPKERSMTIAREAAACGPRACRELKALIAANGDRSMERAAFVRTWSGAEHAEAVARYFAKRGPTS